MNDNRLHDKIPNMIQMAQRARAYAYAPYSHYTVGAALCTEDDTIITGCNIENVAYSPSNCAERTAFFKAISEGYREFKAIAIVAGKEGSKGDIEYPSPCGVCRQVMREFVNPDTFTIIMAKSTEDYKICTLEDLLPMCFGPDFLK